MLHEQEPLQMSKCASASPVSRSGSYAPVSDGRSQTFKLEKPEDDSPYLSPTTDEPTTTISSSRLSSCEATGEFIIAPLATPNSQHVPEPVRCAHFHEHNAEYELVSQVLDSCASKTPPEQVSPIVKDRNIKVATYNVFAGSPYWLPGSKSHSSLFSSGRLEGQIHELMRLDADIICLQEVHCDAALNALQTGLSGRYSSLCALDGSCVLWPFRLAVTAGLVCLAALLAWTCSSVIVFCLTLAAVQYAKTGTTWSFVSSRATGLVILFRKETVRCTEWRRRRYAQQAGDFLNWFRPRGWLEAKFRCNGKTIAVLTTHTNSLSEAQSSVTHALPEKSLYRSEQLKELFEVGATLSSEVDVTVVCGDFNTLPDFGEIPFAATGFEDAWGNERSCNTWDCENPWTVGFQHKQDVKEHGCLDYIFFKRPDGVIEPDDNSAIEDDGENQDVLKVPEQSKTLPACCKMVMNSPPLSDHYGLCATIPYS